MAARANAETAQIPAITLVAIGAVALVFGAVSNPSTTETVGTAASIGQSPQVWEIRSESAEAPQQSIAVESASAVPGEQALTTRVHSSISSSLPRIQAATGAGMREGSGLFVTGEGHIATSAALIDGTDYVLAWTEDGRRWKADLVATDQLSDVAILQIQSSEWPAASLGSEIDLRAGQYALALDHDLDVFMIGEVTGVEGPLVEINQAVAVPGSAIVDDTGTVIAMTTFTGSGTVATPVWRVEQIVVDLIASGHATHSWLGVALVTTPSNPDNMHVNHVIEGSPAALAGVEADDVINSINGTTVATPADVYRLIQAIEPGDEAVTAIAAFWSPSSPNTQADELAAPPAGQNSANDGKCGRANTGTTKGELLATLRIQVRPRPWIEALDIGLDIGPRRFPAEFAEPIVGNHPRFGGVRHDAGRNGDDALFPAEPHDLICD